MLNKPDYSVDRPEEMVNSLNTILDNGLLLGSNLGGQIIENIELIAGQNVAISHNLKITPKYRIILRQDTSSIISDGVLEWTDKKIYLNASADTKITILLMRG